MANGLEMPEYLKMSNYIIIVFLFLHLPPASADNKDIDSTELKLLNRIKNRIYTFREREQFDDLTLFYSMHDQQKGISTLYEFLDQAILNEMDTLRYDCHRSLGFLYSQIGIADRAIENSLIAKSYYDKINEPGNYNWALINIGNTYYWQNLYDNAMNYYKDAYKGFEQMGLDPEVTVDLTGEEAVRLSMDGMAVALNNIALCYVSTGRYYDAIEYHEKALKLRKKMGSSALVAHTYGYIGYPYALTGDLETANDYYYMALDLIKDMSDVSRSELPLYNSTLAFTYRRIAVYYEIKQDLHNAGKYYDSALSIYKEYSNFKELVNTYLRMAETYINLGEINDALPIAFKALEIASEHDYLADQILASDKIASIYSSIGNYEQALNYSRNIIKTDSVLSKNYTEILLLGAEKDIAQRLQTEEMHLLRQERIINEFDLSRQRTISTFLAIISLLILLILIVFFYFFNQKRKTNKKLAEVNASLQAVNKKLLKSEQNLAYINSKLKDKNTILERSEKKLKELNQAKDKFFSILSHDLRGPIANLMQVTELLYKKYGEMTDEKRKTFLKEMKNSTSGLFNLLETLLVWSRSQRNSIEFKPVKVNINSIINDNLKFFNMQAENKNIKINTAFSKRIEAVADPDMLNTVIRNLISNAIKFSSEGKTIVVNAKDHDSFTEISVKDNGTGMTPEIMNNLFTVNESQTIPGTAGERGTGLGLIISKEFIEKHGGTIKVESKPEKGSSFSFTLPKYSVERKNPETSG